MCKRIFLFSRDPGGANVIMPMVEPLEKLGYKVMLYGKEYALKKYEENNLCGIDLSNCIKDISIDNLEIFLKEIDPSAVITSTTAADFTERYLWIAAKRLRIPSYALVDYWLHYGMRFSKYCFPNKDLYERDKTHPYTPDRILVNDEFARQEMLGEGIDDDLIKVTGHHYFQQLRDRFEKYAEEELTSFKRKLGVEQTTFIITYASQPISKFYQGKISLGYDEKSVLLETLDCLEEIMRDLNYQITVLIKLHPRDDVLNYQNILNRYHHEKIKIVSTDHPDNFKVFAISDLVIGLFSTLLMEAVVLKKPVVSAQINLCQEDPFVLSRRGIIPKSTTRESLISRLREVLIEEKKDNCDFDIGENSINLILSIVENDLCKN